MQKKIYVTGMDDDATAAKVDAAVKGVAGAVKAVASVTNVDANVAKCQVCVDFDESTSGIEDAINNAINSTGVMALG